MSERTIREHLAALLPRLAENASEDIPSWPPDAFALCASLLQTTGAYCDPVSVNRNAGKGIGSATWVASVRTLGHKWRESAARDRVIPDVIPAHWCIVLRYASKPVSEVRTNTTLRQSLLWLVATADEACSPSDAPNAQTPSPADESLSLTEVLFEIKRSAALDFDGGQDASSSLCKEIHASRGIVLPKLLTPQSGLTARSFSHHLAFLPASEVRPLWVNTPKRPEWEHNVNLLFIPWPETVRPSQFAPVPSTRAENARHAEGSFVYRHGSNASAVVAHVCRLIEKAEEETGKVDMVVLPELAVDTMTFRRLARLTSRKNIVLICGVGDAPSEDSRAKTTNTVCIRHPVIDFSQHKHHPWKLDRNQIQQYNLGAILHPAKVWWEHIDVRQRALYFLNYNPLLTVSVLVCEDLARPDPVGELVRAVGPQLVIALLMDGPQLKERWPNRYASVLADDPGSSVLSVTSLGMSQLSRPTGQVARSRVVALWRDAVEGTKEIELPPHHAAVVLSLAIFDTFEEWTHDGRSCFRSRPLLAGVHPIVSPPAELKRKSGPAGLKHSAGILLKSSVK